MSHRPRLVLFLWLLLVAGALPLATRVGEVLTAQPGAPAGSVAEDVRTVLASDFQQQNDYTVVLVSRGRASEPGQTEFDRAYNRVANAIEGIPGVTAVQDYRHGAAGLPLVAEDGSYTLSLIGIRAPSTSEAKSVTDAIRKVLQRSSELRFNLSGGPATDQELEAISERDAHRAELFGLPLSLLVLVVAFGALVASALPLLVAITSITLSFAVLFLLGQAIEFAVFTQSIVTMLGLATGIDYALLLVNRFREELRFTDDPQKAAEATALSAGKAVTFSGFTVMIALAALLVPPLSFIRSIGVGAIVVLFVSVAVSTTALPALLSLLGHRVNWLKVTRNEPGQRSRGFWRHRAVRIMRRPLLWAIGGSALLLLLALPALEMEVADAGPRGLSPATDARQVVTALEGVGLEGLLKPFDVLIDFGDEGFFTPSNVRKVSRLTRDLSGLAPIDTVYSPMAVDNLPRLLLYQYYATRETAIDSELQDLVTATVSESGRYVLVRLLPKASITPSEGGPLIAEIRSASATLGLDVKIGGGYVLEAEWIDVLYHSFPLAIGLVYLATLILLGLAFRSLLIPLKSIVLNTLTVGATYGVITLIFQEGWLSRLVGLQSGLGFVDSSAPLFIFAIVFGLSMDYEVFLVARIYEAHQRGLSDRDAVVSALSATGGVITSAAAVMIVVFSIFVFSEVVLIKTLGFGLALAVLIDATLVRVALVPAMMILAGRWNWWLPRPMARLVDRVGLSHD